MRVICAVLALALLGAGSPEPAASPPAADRFAELLGTWTCRDGANVASTLTFSRDSDAIVGTERKTTPSGSADVDMLRYRFDPQKARWRVEGRHGFGSFLGSAPPWTGTEWNVEGTTTYTYAAQAGSEQGPRTIRYVRVGDGVMYRGTPDAGPLHVIGEVCALGTTPPDAALCPAKRVPATALNVPLLDPQYGDRGRVEVAVSLDAESRVVGTRVASSTNPSLNRTAEYVARKSTFRTEYRDCHPVPSEYLFSVQAV